MTGWPRTLSWDNFQSLSNPGPGQLVARNGRPIVARVAISIMFYQDSSPTVTEGGRTRFSTADVRVILNSNQTQYVPSRIPPGQSAHYLRHEQGHMDLMGLFGRELEVNLLALRAPDTTQLLAQANPIVDEAVRSARMYAINVPTMDCLYDQETNHGMNRGEQTRWNRTIADNIARWREPDFRFRT